jgi:predicted nucleic acid-binding protein
VATYLADTSAWQRSGKVEERWEALLEAAELATCAPVRLELLYSARGKNDYGQLAFDLSRLPQLALAESAEHLALVNQAKLARRAQHPGPRPLDLLIAAIAQAHGATLLHYDRHFEQIARVTGQPTEWLARPGSLA